MFLTKAKKNIEKDWVQNPTANSEASMLLSNQPYSGFNSCFFDKMTIYVSYPENTIVIKKKNRMHGI